MKFCCRSFEANIFNPYDKGTNIIPIIEQDTSQFILFFLSVSYNDLTKILHQNSSLGNLNFDFTLFTQIHLNFCPWCGQSLEKLIKNQEKEFDVLCDEYKHYYETIIKQ